MTDQDVKPRKTKAMEKLGEIMMTYYMEAKAPPEERNNKKIAWITSGGPVEPLIAMDMIPVYPENHAAMVGASKMGGDLCARAEEMGYAGDLCSYARSDIACATVNGGPIGGLPKPDLLVCCNNICGTVMKWYEVQARYYDVPLFIFDTPICHTEFSEEARQYVIAQFMDYISVLEKVCGRKMNLDTLLEVGARSLEAQRLWQDILDTTTARPSPMTAFDAFFYLALIVTLRGQQIIVDFYKDLLAEMKQKVADGIGVLKEEKYRLLWDNLPIWYKMRWLSKKFAARGACLVADTYTSAWCSSMKYINEDDLLNSLAEAYTRIYLNIGVDRMADTVIEMIRKYDVDGLVLHSNRSCKPYSFGQYDIEKIVKAKTGIPTLMIEADMVDERHFAEGPIDTRIDVFMEILEKAGKK